MRRIQHSLTLLTITLVSGSALLLAPLKVTAETVGAPSLTISQFKITSSNGQFITLYNSSNTTLDMSKFQLQYFNSYDLGKASSSRLIPLSGMLPSHGYYMVSDDSLPLCRQMQVASTSLGFSSTAGMVQVLGLSQLATGGSVVPTLLDYVSWAKTPVVGVQTLPSSNAGSLLRQPVDAQKRPLVTVPGAGSWLAVQPDPAQSCNFVSYSGIISTNIDTGTLLLPGIEPEVTILSGLEDQLIAAGQGIPVADIDLMAPRITEILPNPSGSNNDATEEFIELYNPNDVTFDLSGFKVQSGITTPRSFTFPNGVQLPPKGYVAFYANDTGLSLSNTSGQVMLFDPLSNLLSTTTVYANAKDGQAWALANGKWLYTTRITPNAANIIIEPAVVTKKSTKTKATGAEKSAVAKKKAVPKTKSTKLVAATVAKGSDVEPLRPIHMRTLVMVAVAAVLYGAYEYRADIANRIYQLTSYVRRRR